MANWILKTEPTTYSFDDLVKAKKAVWDGVTNPVAVRNIRAMKPGDAVMIYHTGDEKSCVGLAEVESAPYPDPGDKSGKLWVVNLVAGRRLAKPVPLAAIKGARPFEESPLARQPRLSVIPVTAPQWDWLIEQAEG